MKMITYNINGKYITYTTYALFPLTYMNIQNIISIYIYILQTSMKHYFSSMTSEQGKSGSLLYQEVFVNRKVPDNSHNNKSTKQKLKYYAWECFTSKANNIVLMILSVFYCLNDPEPKTTVETTFPPKQRKATDTIFRVHSTSSFMRRSLMTQSS